MSQDLSRRPLLIALGAIAGVVVAAGGAYEAGLFGHHFHSPAEYKDLLSGLADRDAANRLGEAVLAETGTFETGQIARGLRKRIAHRPLAAVLADDLAEGRMVETKGWVLPETLALLCGLSAKLG
ncbi:MAG TPA: hypothetical protein VL971_03440 [Rhizomicrobium sp.]|nr:hypothetical protein [Rhizomicrobium sp.]